MDQNKRKTILIVEDEAILRKALLGVLQKQNFSILEAENGLEGVTQALKMHPDLILLDIKMPVMGGMEALKKIRNDAWGTQVPVVMLTNLSAAKEDLVQDMVEGRPLYYLIKSDWKIFDVVKKIKDILRV